MVGFKLTPGYLFIYPPPMKSDGALTIIINGALAVARITNKWATGGCIWWSKIEPFQRSPQGILDAIWAFSTGHVISFCFILKAVIFWKNSDFCDICGLVRAWNMENVTFWSLHQKWKMSHFCHICGPVRAWNMANITFWPMVVLGIGIGIGIGIVVGSIFEVGFVGDPRYREG